MLHDSHILPPSPLFIALQDDVTGDGTTSTVLLCGELLRQADRYASEGLHPRVITDGFDIARDATVKFLDEFKVNLDDSKNSDTQKRGIAQDRELMTCIASTSLHTKLDHELASKMTDAVVDAIQCIAPSTPDEKEVDVDGVDGDETKMDESPTRRPTTQPIDLNMIEVMTMQRKMGTDSRFVNGLVLDHGGRHPDMPKVLVNCHIMTCNVTFEYEQTEVQSGFFYSNAEEREKLVESERKWLDERCKAVVDFKRSVCKEGEHFVMINQKGIDPLSLDIFAKEGILALRRAKRRNMERMTKACGGSPIHSVEDLDSAQLGFAGKVSEVTLGEDKFTFVEECRHPKSCTLLLQGPNTHTIDMIKDAVRDGLRAVKNAVEDRAVVPGGGAFEIAAALHLRETVVKATKGRAKLGVEAFAEALLIVPKTLAENSGFDVQESILKLTEERELSGLAVGLDVSTGEPMVAADEGIWDNARVKRQSLFLSTVLANQLLLVDEVMRAGKNRGKPSPMDE
jgi:T-complex protein 1 subunit zeta